MSELTEQNGKPWPPLIECLPEADLQIEGLRGRILKCADFWVLFMTADREVTVPSHRHGAQWGVVLSGSMDLTIGETRRTYGHGDMHYIPAHVDHEAVLHEGWQGLYIFKRGSLESK